MYEREVIFVVGCNAAGKSSFIRTRFSQLSDFFVIMTDVYKSRTKPIFEEALKQKRNIVVETVFNDASFAKMVDQARNLGYRTSMIALFLDSPKHSLERVAFRSLEQNGLVISGSNIQINFNESFKNIATYFFYFDEAVFIYTGITGKNSEIMRFEKSKLMKYKESDLQYPQVFADYAYRQQRLSEEAYDVIKRNHNYDRGDEISYQPKR